MVAGAAPALYSIGPDGSGVGRMFSAIVPSSSGTALGDGSIAFNGGLTYSAAAGLMFVIGNDSFGQSFLTSFSLATPAALTPLLALGSGFLGGLALNTDTGVLYAVASDVTGLSTLYRLDAGGGAPVAIGDLGFGFVGGLAYDPDDQNLYAVSWDAFGVPRQFNRIEIGAGGVTVTSLFALGDGSLGFNGGIAYDPDALRFAVISNDFMGNSALQAFTLGGAATLTDLGVAIGQGFVNVALAIAPAGPTPPTAPEPSTILLAGIAIVALARRRSRAARQRTAL